MIVPQQSTPSKRWAEWLGRSAPALLLASGLCWRLLSAHASFLNADEAMHYLLSRQQSLADAYRASLGTAHPPLLILLLYYWAKISTKEFFLRLPSAIAGTASAWFLYGWLRLVSQRATASIAMALLLFSPALIYTSAEVRQYALVLGFISAALYLVERALLANSALMMMGSAVSLYLALLTHYSALIFAASLAIYGVLRMASARPSPPFVIIWILTQAGAAGIAIFLWKTHISLIRHRSLIQDVAQSYLRNSLFHPQQENVFLFLVRANLRLFHFVFSQGAVAALAMVLFVAGMIQLFARTSRRQKPAASSRQLAILLLVPLLINAAAALAGAYPYGGTRHDSYLALFIMPAVATPLACWKTGARWIKPLVIAGALAACNFTVTPAGAYIKPKNQKKELMHAAIGYLRSSAPPGSIILTDYESGLLLSYYLCQKDITHTGLLVGSFYHSSCGAYDSVSLLPRLWVFHADSFSSQFAALQKSLPQIQNRELWLFQAGFIVDRESDFQAMLTHYGCANPQRFGANILECRITPPASREASAGKFGAAK